MADTCYSEDTNKEAPATQERSGAGTKETKRWCERLLEQPITNWQKKGGPNTYWRAEVIVP